MVLLLCITMLMMLHASAALDIDCERFSTKALGTKRYSICYLNSFSSINSTGFLLSSSRNESIQAISFAYNSKINYLPENIAEKFPNLVIFYASNSSIQSISKDNFKNLRKLERLYLGKNYITRIDGDTFRSLIAVDRIELRKNLVVLLNTLIKTFFSDDNKIKFIDGDAFKRLSKLMYIRLHGNECIDKDFKNKSQLAILTQTVSQTCSNFPTTESAALITSATTPRSRLTTKKFTNTTESPTTLRIETDKTVIDLLKEIIDDQKKRIQILDSSNKKAVLEKENCKLEVASLKGELKAKKDAEIKIESQRQEIIEAKTQELHKTIEMKIQENSDLLQQLQLKNIEMNNKNEKIRQLEEKVLILSRAQ